MPPPWSRPCNRFMCPSQVTTWSAGSWSQCALPSQALHEGVPASCRSGVGSRSRSVECRSVTLSNGTATADNIDGGGVGGSAGAVTTSILPSFAVVNDSMCLSGDGALGKPSSSEICSVVATCACSVDADCSDTPHSVCGEDDGVRKCVCEQGWGGAGCSIRLLVSTAATPCAGEQCLSSTGARLRSQRVRVADDGGDAKWRHPLG